MGFPSDAMLGRLTRMPFGDVRRWAARKAADRALHVPALQGAPQDPYVLARLGLYQAALENPAIDDAAKFGALLAKTALGRIGALVDAGEMDSAKSLLLAKALAPHSPMAAARLINDDDTLVQAACYVAAGMIPKAIDVLGAQEGREAVGLLAHCHVKSGEFAKARETLNILFTDDRLSPPLDMTEQPFGMADLQHRIMLPRNGPLVSVIIPYHNAASTLETALRSAIGQCWRDIEILVVDDRSTDAGADIARKLADEDDRITLLSNSRKPGVYGARNTAIEAARGEYLAFLDADDWMPAEKIARQMDKIGNAVAIIANHIRMAEDGAPVAPRVFPLVRPVPITMLVQREIVLAAGLFDEVETGADSEMLARLEMLYGKRAIGRDPAVLLVARWREGSLSEAREGGMFGAERTAYRTRWMFAHAELEPPIFE